MPRSYHPAGLFGALQLQAQGDPSRAFRCSQSERCGPRRGEWFFYPWNIWANPLGEDNSDVLIRKQHFEKDAFKYATCGTSGKGSGLKTFTRSKLGNTSALVSLLLLFCGALLARCVLICEYGVHACLYTAPSHAYLKLGNTMYVHYNTYLRWQLFVSPGPRERGCINDTLYVILMFQHFSYVCKTFVHRLWCIHTSLFFIETWTTEQMKGLWAPRLLEILLLLQLIGSWQFKMFEYSMVYICILVCE